MITLKQARAVRFISHARVVTRYLIGSQATTSVFLAIVFGLSACDGNKFELSHAGNIKTEAEAHTSLFQEQLTKMNPAVPEKIEQTRYVQWGQQTPEYGVIWLHGLGASSDDFPPVVSHLGLDKSLNIQFIFPHAPDRAVTINGGMRMPAWYDIKSLSMNERVDREGIADSLDTVLWHVNWLKEKGVPSERIIIAGFSQGGAVSYYGLLRAQQKFAGILLLSTYMPFMEEAAEAKQPINQNTPVFVGHGSNDPVVPITMGDSSADKLQELSYQLTRKVYPMEHSVSLDEINDIGKWMNDVFTAL